MFFVSFFVSNKLFECDNIYLYNMQKVGKQRSLLQYTNSNPSKGQEHNELATLNHKQEQ